MWPYLKATINGDQLYVDLIDDSAPIPSIYWLPRAFHVASSVERSHPEESQQLTWSPFSWGIPRISNCRPPPQLASRCDCLRREETDWLLIEDQSSIPPHLNILLQLLVRTGTTIEILQMWVGTATKEESYNLTMIALSCETSTQSVSCFGQRCRPGSRQIPKFSPRSRSSPTWLPEKVPCILSSLVYRCLS